MSQVRLVIRDAQRSVWADRHGGFADRVIAALGDDPETLDELDRALERFIAPDEWSNLRGFYEGVDDRPFDAGVVIIDLAARLIVCDSTYSEAMTDGFVAYDDRTGATDVHIGYHLDNDWLIVRDTMGWRGLANERRGARASRPPRDVRAVVYGPPLLAFIARACFDAFAEAGEPPEPDWNSPQYRAERDRVKDIHARWLLEPLDALNGDSPRDAMMARLRHVDRCLHDRSERWSMMLEPPRGLDPESAAYRFAGFGTHEMVVYYDLVRDLIWTARLQLVRWMRTLDAAGSADAFHKAIGPVLAEQLECLLDEPNPEFDGRTPRSIIANERARVPEAMTGEEAVVDHDCPLCRMQAEMPGPVFWFLDGCNMDDEFAFSIHHDTREQWDAEQRENEAWTERYKRERAERERLGVSDERVWRTSFAAEPHPDAPMVMRLFALGANLGELLANLKETAMDGSDAPAQPALAERVDRSFANLRDIAGSEDPARADALVGPVIDGFFATLDDVAEARPDLRLKCDSLRNRLGHLLDVPGDDTDDDIPY